MTAYAFQKAIETTCRCRVWQLACRCFAFALLSSNFMVAQAPELAVDPANIGTTGKITFRVADPDLASNPAIQMQYSYETDDHQYTALVDPAGIQPVHASPLGEYTFTVLVKRRGDTNWYAYGVIASPLGDFEDVVDDVHCRIGQGPQAAALTIKLPLHSSQHHGDLVWKTGESQELQVRVSDSQGPAIPLQNTLKSLTIHVTNIEVRPSCGQCWQQVQSGPVDIQSSGDQALPLNIRPRALSALVSTASKIKRGDTHDRLTVTVYYNVDQGGPPKHTQFDVSVRFSPSFWQLSMVVIAGSLLGLALRGVLEKLRPAKKGSAANQQAPSRWRSLGKTVAHAGTTLFLTSVAVGLLIVVAFSDSRFVILGLDLDPRQMIPAFIIAGFIAGGSTVRKWATGIIQLGQGDKNQAAVAGGSGD